MKYIKKLPDTDKALSEKLTLNNWKKIKEPSNFTWTILLSTPFMLINGAIEMFIFYNLYTPLQDFLKSNEGFNITLELHLVTLLFIPVIFIFMTIHEFLHACFIPNVLKSDKTYWGINGICGFVTTSEKIKKSRFLLISIMPLLILSIVLPFVLNAFGWLNGYTIFLCLLNAMGSCVDCLNICLIATQVPNGAYVLNNGFETYFK